MFGGYQAQGQYQAFRGSLSPEDSAGKYATQLYSEEIRDQILIISSSRFSARVASLWMDANNQLALYETGSSLDSSIVSEGTSLVLVLGDFRLSDEFERVTSGEGYAYYKLHSN
jgi:hypothetical protein